MHSWHLEIEKNKSMDFFFSSLFHDFACTEGLYGMHFDHLICIHVELIMYHKLNSANTYETDSDLHLWKIK
jgi:hypothetical protein